MLADGFIRGELLVLVVTLRALSAPTMPVP